jgi:hypothetical protein
LKERIILGTTHYMLVVGDRGASLDASLIDDFAKRYVR